MKRVLYITVFLLQSVALFAQSVVFNDVKFDDNNLIIYISLQNIKRYDIVEALKRGLEGRIEYTIEIVNKPALPLLSKEIIKSVTVRKKVKFDFFNKAYIVSKFNTTTLFYSDESLLEELFNNRQFVIPNMYKFKNSNYLIRMRVAFTSVKLYFPLNLIFNYIVGIWDFDTGWEYGPKLTGVPYTE